MDEDEELWFNDDDDDEDGETVDKSRMEDDFSDGYGKYMEAKKGKICPCMYLLYRPTWLLMLIYLHMTTIGAANGANSANNNGKSAAIPPSSAAISVNSSASSVKTVALPATPVVKVMNMNHFLV